MTADANLRFCTFHKEAQSGVGVFFSLFRPSPLQYIAHLERLDGLRLQSLHYVSMTDELDVKATYKEHVFSISMAWRGDLDLTASALVPQETFDMVCGHMQRYRRVGFFALTQAKARYARLAKSAG